MAGAGGIRAGAAYVELYLKNNKFVRGLSRSSARLKAFGGSMMRIGAAVTAAGAAIVGPIMAAAKAFAATGDKLDKMSARTGLAVDFLSELGHAAQLGGTDIETMEKSVRKLQTAALDANDGLKTYTDLFDKLGVTVQGTDRQLKATPELFKETIVALSKLENHTEKAGIANKLFGRSGTALLPMLREGEKGLAAAMEEARRLGLVLTKEDATAAAKLTDAWTRMKAVMHAAWIRVGGAVAEMITKLANKLADIGAKVVDFVKKNQPLIVSLFKVGAAIMAAGAAISIAGAAIMGFGFTLGAVAMIISTVGSAIGLIGTALTALLSPIGLVAAAVVGLGAYLLKTTGAGKKAIDALSTSFGRLKEDALRAFGGIADAMKAGDISLAAQILWATVLVEWTKGVNAIYEVWIKFKQKFMDSWTNISAKIATLFVFDAQTLATLEEDRARANKQRADRYGAELAERARKLQDLKREMEALISGAKAKREQADYKRELEQKIKEASQDGGAVSAIGGRVAGTFSAAAAARLGMGGNAQERMAAATEDIKETNKQVARNTHRLLMQWGD